MAHATTAADAPSACPAIPHLLAEFFCPQTVTLPSILTKHNITPQQLLAWIKSPEHQSTIEAIHQLNHIRSDFALSHARADSIGVLSRIQEHYRDQLDSCLNGYGVSPRLTESARKASLHLLTLTGDLKSPPPRSRVLQDPRAGAPDPQPPEARRHASAEAPANNTAHETAPAQPERTPSPDAAPPPPPAQRVRERSGRGQERVEESPGRPTGFAPSPTPTPPSPTPNPRASDRCSERSLPNNTAPTNPQSGAGVPPAGQEMPAPNAGASPQPPTSEDLFRRVEELLQARTQQRTPSQPSAP